MIILKYMYNTEKTQTSIDKYIPGNELQYAVVEASIMKITILHTNLSARPRVPISVLVIPNTQCMTFVSCGT